LSDEMQEEMRGIVEKDSHSPVKGLTS